MAREENAVQRACLDLLQLLGIFHWRANNAGVYDPAKQCFRAFVGARGVADIIAVLPVPVLQPVDGGRRRYKIGQILCCECKSANGRQSRAQKQFQAAIEAAGGIYVIARGVADLEQVLRREGVLA